MDKYNIGFEVEVFEANIKRLTNQIWKLIPIREETGDWGKQIETIIIEIAGLKEIYGQPQFLQLLSKLEGLRVVDTQFEVYRKTVFESIGLLQELRKNV